MAKPRDKAFFQQFIANTENMDKNINILIQRFKNILSKEEIKPHIDEFKDWLNSEEKISFVHPDIKPSIETIKSLYKRTEILSTMVLAQTKQAAFIASQNMLTKKISPKAATDQVDQFDKDLREVMVLISELEKRVSKKAVEFKEIKGLESKDVKEENFFSEAKTLTAEDYYKQGMIYLDRQNQYTVKQKQVGENPQLHSIFLNKAEAYKNKAITNLREAAKTGHLFARFELNLLGNSKIEVTGLTKLAAKAGNAKATSLMAKAPENINWIRLAAAQGDSTAQEELARRYSSGKGVTQNTNIAAMWLSKSCEEKKDTFTAARIAEYYENGQLNYPYDPDQAAIWRARVIAYTPPQKIDFRKCLRFDPTPFDNINPKWEISTLFHIGALLASPTGRGWQYSEITQAYHNLAENDPYLFCVLSRKIKEDSLRGLPEELKNNICAYATHGLITGELQRQILTSSEYPLLPMGVTSLIADYIIAKTATNTLPVQEWLTFTNYIDSLEAQLLPLLVDEKLSKGEIMILNDILDQLADQKADFAYNTLFKTDVYTQSTKDLIRAIDEKLKSSTPTSTSSVTVFTQSTSSPIVTICNAARQSAYPKGLDNPSTISEMKYKKY